MQQQSFDSQLLEDPSPFPLSQLSTGWKRGQSNAPVRPLALSSLYIEHLYFYWAIQQEQQQKKLYFIPELE